MKESLRLVLTFILVMCVSFQSFADESNPPMDNPIPIKDRKGGIYRSPVPIQCYYSDGELTFTFSATLGTVECEVVRVSDDEVFDATFYAVSGGTDSLYVSTDAGEYEITLTLSNGTVYYGEYSIE